MMDDNKVVRIPISYTQRKVNEYGSGYVPCQISSRWLQFDGIISKDLDFIFVDVMTKNDDGKESKICQLCLDAKDIMRALNSAEQK